MMFRLPRATIVCFFLLACIGMVFGEAEVPINPQILADNIAEEVRQNPTQAEEIVRQAVLNWDASGGGDESKKALAAIVGAAVAALPRDRAAEALFGAVMSKPSAAPIIAQAALEVFPEGVRIRSTDTLPIAGMRPSVAKVLRIAGVAAESVGADGKRSALKVGDFVAQGAEISTGAATAVDLLFENGTTLRIEPESSLSIDRLMGAPFDTASVDFRSVKEEPSRSSTLIGVSEGTVFFDVAELKNPSTFEIATPVGVCGIRGTAGYIRIDSSGGGGDSSFGLSSGLAEFTTPNGVRMEVRAGDSIGISGRNQGYRMQSNVDASRELLKKSSEIGNENRSTIGNDPFRGAPISSGSADVGALPAAYRQALEEAALEGDEAIAQTALLLAMQAPELAPEIAMLATGLMPSAAVQIVLSISRVMPTRAPAIAAAVAAVVPSMASTIITELLHERQNLSLSVVSAVAAIVPMQANRIVFDVSREFPELASGISAAVSTLVPAQGDAISSALQIAAQPGGAPGSQAPINPPVPDISSQNPSALNGASGLGTTPTPRPTPTPQSTPTPRPTPTPTPTPVSPSA